MATAIEPPMRRLWMLFVLAIGLGVLTLAGVTLIRNHPALPAEARAALDRYMPVEPSYRVLSVYAAPEPANFAGICSFFDAENPGEMWCVQVEGGHSYASHYLLHGGPETDGTVWNVIPIFDFDRATYESVGCTDW